MRLVPRVRDMKFSLAVLLAAAGALAGCAALDNAQSSDSDPAKPLLRLTNEVWNAGDYAVTPQVVARDATLHIGDKTLVSSQAFADLARMWRIAFPDLHVTVEDVIVQGDKVAMRLTFKGRQTGPFLGHGATGKHISVTDTIVCQIEDAMLKNCWQGGDEYALRRQLGFVMPASPAAH